MKARLFVLTALLLLVGCSLISSPTATAKKYMTAAEKGDVETMNGLFSSKAVQILGSEKLRSNNQNFSDMIRKSIAAGTKPKIDQLKETSTGDMARVSFSYGDSARNDSISLGLDLIKENGDWKIVRVGDHKGLPVADSDVPTTTAPTLTEEPPPPPPAPANAGSTPETKGKTVSGGVLNGKAISLPKPPYPPVAKAARASGTVVVAVTVDENGNVIAAHAVSGHPLLQAAAVAAARNAKFSPTKLSGQPVKVSGILNYNFPAE